MAGRMQWDDAAKSILLVKILEIHEISVDCQKIADSWPEGGHKPTPRAIREAIFKIRRETGVKAGSPLGSPNTPKSSTKKTRNKVTKSTPGDDASPSERRRKRNVSAASAKKLNEDAAAERDDPTLPTFKSEYESLDEFDMHGELKEEDLAGFDA